MRSRRLQAIDAARGLAMVLVCLSHVRVHFESEAPALYFLLTSITRIATPTFLLLSGFVAAFVLANGDRRTRMALVDRGLFVLIIGHFLLNLDDLRSTELEHWIFGRITITDAIGVCLICAAALYRLPAKVLGLLGAALAILSWPIAMTQSYEAPVARYLGAALFDLQSESGALIDAAIVPYLGVFAIGMSLSKVSLPDLRLDAFRSVARRVAVAGAIALCLVAGLLALWFALEFFQLSPTDPVVSEFVRKTIDPRSKLPPGPSYLLFYGGCGLLLTAACLIAKPKALMRPVIEWASTIGRASLMCFIAQDWMLKLFPAVLGFEGTTSVVFWSAYVCIAIAMLHWLAHRWDAAAANRYLTLGLRRLATRSGPR